MPHRYFTTDISGGTAVLSGADAHHLAHVMRARPGETVTLCDGKGTDYACAVRSFGPDTVELEILSSVSSVSEPGVRVTLYVGYPKQDRLETIVQKAVELGAVRIVPFFSRYCVAAPKKEEQKNLRYNRIAFEAAKQSGRGRIPQVREMMDLRPALEEMAARPGAMLFYERSTAPMREVLDRIEGEASLLIGAEGGFDESEVELALSMGIPSLTLGPRILRCETAPMAALSVLMYHTGNMN